MARPERFELPTAWFVDMPLGLFIYIYDQKDIFSLLIPNKFPLNRPRWADLAVSGVRLLGTVVQRCLICGCMPLLFGELRWSFLQANNQTITGQFRIFLASRRLFTPLIDVWLRIRHAHGIITNSRKTPLFCINLFTLASRSGAANR
jgi:hypothetical protein